MQSLTITTPQGADPSKAPEGSTASTSDGLTSAAVPTETPPSAPNTKLAGKYDSPADLEKAYLALQSKLGEKPPESPKDAPKIPTIEAPSAAEKAVQAAGLDLNALSDEFAANGALSAESLATLSQHGVSKETVEQYVQGAIATAQQHFNEVAAVAGGADRFNQMLEWAKANASEADVKAFNDAVATKNLGVIKLATQSINAQFTKATGTAPQLVNAETVPSVGQGIQPFKSSYEVTQAMRSARYKNDPAYRAEVIARLDKTDMFGV